MLKTEVGELSRRVLQQGAAIGVLEQRVNSGIVEAHATGLSKTEIPNLKETYNHAGKLSQQRTLTVAAKGT